MITKNLPNEAIGNRIKQRRQDLNLTLQEIASSVGVAVSTIQRYERGTISRYKLPVVESIAKTLQVNPLWLIKEDAPMLLNNNSDDLLTSIVEKYEQLDHNYKKLIESQINQLLELQNKN